MKGILGKADSSRILYHFDIVPGIATISCQVELVMEV